jgi:hypothetical protein
LALRRSSLVAGALGLKALDLGFDRGPIDDARRPVAAGKTRDERLKALEAFDVQAVELGEWIGSATACLPRLSPPAASPACIAAISRSAKGSSRAAS